MSLLAIPTVEENLAKCLHNTFHNGYYVNDQPFDFVGMSKCFEMAQEGDSRKILNALSYYPQLMVNDMELEISNLRSLLGFIQAGCKAIRRINGPQADLTECEKDIYEAFKDAFKTELEIEF